MYLSVDNQLQAIKKCKGMLLKKRVYLRSHNHLEHFLRKTTHRKKKIQEKYTACVYNCIILQQTSTMYQKAIVCKDREIVEEV